MLNSLDKAKEHFERLTYLLEMMKLKDCPKWYAVENKKAICLVYRLLSTSGNPHDEYLIKLKRYLLR